MPINSASKSLSPKAQAQIRAPIYEVAATLAAFGTIVFYFISRLPFSFASEFPVPQLPFLFGAIALFCTFLGSRFFGVAYPPPPPEPVAIDPVIEFRTQFIAKIIAAAFAIATSLVFLSLLIHNLKTSWTLAASPGALFLSHDAEYYRKMAYVDLGGTLIPIMLVFTQAIREMKHLRGAKRDPAGIRKHRP